MATLRKVLFLLQCCIVSMHGFAPAASTYTSFAKFKAVSIFRSQQLPLKITADPSPEANGDSIVIDNTTSQQKLTPEQQELVGNLVADEEWAGLSMELADVVRTAVIEDLKKNAREFLKKDEYAIGDFSKEIDRRVKDEVAKMREKDEYELGDFSVVLDSKIKDLVCEMSGKEEYEFGDLSLDIDRRVKESVAKFCGKDSYEIGDLSKELGNRINKGVLKYTGKDSYVLGDLSKELAKRTKEGVLNYTGKDDYQFGDVTKKLMGNLFGGKKSGKE